MRRELREHALITRLTTGLPRSPHQLNRPHESDAELVRLPGGATLAVNTDGVVEEVASGLYDDPYLVGWMTVTGAASDLAAVGAAPVGLLVNVTIPSRDTALATELARGIGDSARAQKMPVLGGDTNLGGRLQTAATAVGLVSGGAPLTRVGCAPGDLLFVSGPVGLGSALAARRFGAANDGTATAQTATTGFRPVARLSEGRLLRSIAGCCIDTSDGLIAALDELMRRNTVGLRVTASVESLLDARALAAASLARVPPWAMLAGPHGEYELVFTVSASRRRSLWRTARARGWAPLEIGEVTADGVLTLRIAGRDVQLDAGEVRDLFDAAGGSVEAFVTELRRIDAELGVSAPGRRRERVGVPE